MENFVAECQLCGVKFNEEEFQNCGGELCVECGDFYCNDCISMNKDYEYVCLNCK